MPDLPTGTVTFLFTDVEGSTRLLDQHPAAYRAAIRRGDQAGSRALGQQMLTLCRALGDRELLLRALLRVSTAACFQSDLAAARVLREEHVVLLREAGDRRGLVVALANLGHTCRFAGDFAAAQRLFDEGSALCRQLGITSHDLLNDVEGSTPPRTARPCYAAMRCPAERKEPRTGLATHPGPSAPSELANA